MLKWLGRLLLALLIALLLGLAIGAWLRLRLERPVYYIGAVGTPEPTAGPGGGPPPLDRLGPSVRRRLKPPGAAA